jgi:hypothetical protein
MEMTYNNRVVGNCTVKHNGVEVSFNYVGWADGYRLTKDSAKRATEIGILQRLEATLNGSTEYLEDEQQEVKARKYDVYFKDVSELDEVDVYQVHQLFNVLDASGCLHHSSKKILLPGVRTGGKERYEDIEEARDTLNRWLEINK